MGTGIRIEISMEATPGRVFEALTRNEELTAWFCEAADVSIEEGRYDFWGRYTPEAPGRGEGRHPLLASVPARGLSYEWRVRGGDSRVDLALEPVSGGTRLVLAHTAPGRAREDASLADYWGLSLENLEAWLARGVVGGRRDHAAKPAREIRLRVEIDASREAVFRALTDPAQLERYIAEEGRAVVEPRVGGRFDFGWDDGGPVRVLAFEPHSLIAYSWEYEGEPDTRVTWSLEDAEGKTRLTLAHEGFAGEDLYDPYCTGWLKFLNRVKHLVEGGAAWRPAHTMANDYEATRADA